MKRVVVVFNPRAGSGQAARVAAAAQSRLVKEGWSVEVRPTKDRAGATPAARELGPDVDLFVVVGGDGSLREAVVGLGAELERVPVGLLPFGNANVVARELEIPLDPEEAVENLVTGAPRAIDVGYVDGTPFLAMVGIGWDALSVNLLDRIRHTRIGKHWYRLWADSVYGVVGALALCKPFQPRFEVTVDGEPHGEPLVGAVLSSCRTYGKGWWMTPDARPDNGRIDFQLRKRAFVPFAVWHLLAAVLRKRSPRFISDYGHGRKLFVKSARPVPAQIDGDFLGFVSELEVWIEPTAVRIIAPPTAAATDEDAAVAAEAQRRTKV